MPRKIGEDRYGGVTGITRPRRRADRVIVGLRPWSESATRWMPQIARNVEPETRDPLPGPSPFLLARDKT